MAARTSRLRRRFSISDIAYLGIDDEGHKSVLSTVQGDKDNRATWKVVFDELKTRGLDASAVRFGVMDGLPGMAAQFRESFPNALVGRCWVHKATNVFARVPKRYQAAFKTSWDAVQYAADGAAAREAYKALQEQWSASSGDAVASMERDLEELLAHYEMPREGSHSSSRPVSRNSRRSLSAATCRSTS